ncbi:MAG: hypothetical protein GXO54_04840 [Chloroflexi bacterium]|nr:hypothetical protein [Chloroflexota bacterium]
MTLVWGTFTFLIVGALAIGLLAWWRPWLKGAWWVAGGTLTLAWLAWIIQVPKSAVTWSWLPEALGQYVHLLFTPERWALALGVLTASWAGWAIAAYRASNDISHPTLWMAWLGFTAAALLAVLASGVWAWLWSWVVMDAAVYALEAWAAPAARGHAARRWAWRAVASLAPWLALFVPQTWLPWLWAWAALARAWVMDPPGRQGRWRVVLGPGVWIALMPWWLTLLPLFQSPWPVEYAPGLGWLLGLALVLFALRWLLAPGLRAGFAGWAGLSTVLAFAVRALDPAGGRGLFWLTLLWVTALFLFWLEEGGEAWWLVGGVPIALAWTMWPFTPGATALYAWPGTWHEAVGWWFVSQSLLLAGALSFVRPRVPRPSSVLRGAQALAWAGGMLPGLVLWGLSLRFHWLTPPPQLTPGWIAWIWGPAAWAVAFGLGFSLSRIPEPWARRALQSFLRWRGYARVLRRQAWRTWEDLVLFASEILEGRGGLVWALVVLVLIALFMTEGGEP